MRSSARQSSIARLERKLRPGPDAVGSWGPPAIADLIGRIEAALQARERS